VKRSWSIPKPTNTSNGSTLKPGEPDYGGYLKAYSNREVPFRFRGIGFRFALSLGLFSSADIDRGTRLLLKVLSRLLDESMGGILPGRVLDAGCGIGIIGICAARALMAAGAESLRLRAQDRDELARIFSGGNAVKNGIPPGLFSARTESLLASPAGETWDLILSNIPAKAGAPVLEDFVPRSTGILAPEGRVLIVAVNTLADFFRRRINASARLLGEEAGPGHTVFVYARPPAPKGETAAGSSREESFLKAHRFYLRNSGDYEMEGAGYHIDSVYGAAEFDRPCGAAEAAARLVCRLGPGKLFAPGPFLIHEGGQGHFSAWLLGFLRQKAPLPEPLILHGRNILALEAARDNTATAYPGGKGPIRIVPGVDLALDAEILRRAPAGHTGEGYRFIAAFPELVPRTGRLGDIWKALGTLLLPGGTALLSLPAAEAERFGRQKPGHGGEGEIPGQGGFIRLGDLKRQGFRAMAFRKEQEGLDQNFA
jgi:SAM-dependent methyltransferase